MLTLYSQSQKLTDLVYTAIIIANKQSCVHEHSLMIQID